jgi:hypothetical protein
MPAFAWVLIGVVGGGIIFTVAGVYFLVWLLKDLWPW